MKKYILINALILSLITVFSSSCKKDVPAGGTAVEKMAGDWYVTVDKGEDIFSLYSFNTASNSSTEMWLETSAGFSNGTSVIAVKGKVSVDLASQTFSATSITNEATTKATIPTFAVANGKVVPNGTVGPASKTPADLITFDLIINGVTYKIEGYHKTGFLEDIP